LIKSEVKRYERDAVSFFVPDFYRQMKKNKKPCGSKIFGKQMV